MIEISFATYPALLLTPPCGYSFKPSDHEEEIDEENVQPPITLGWKVMTILIDLIAPKTRNSLA